LENVRNATRSTKQLAAAKISSRPTHVILATRADGSDAVKIGSGWQRASGDLHLKLDQVPLGYQQIVVRAVAEAREVKPKAMAGRVRKRQRYVKSA
jgi:hypothetical protein